MEDQLCWKIGFLLQVFSYRYVSSHLERDSLIAHTAALGFHFDGSDHKGFLSERIFLFREPWPLWRSFGKLYTLINSLRENGLKCSEVSIYQNTIPVGDERAL